MTLINYDCDVIVIMIAIRQKIKEIAYREIKCECFIGHVLLLLNAINVVCAFNKCYTMNGQQYCFYTDGSVLSWDEAREFCSKKYSTLPIITDKKSDDAFQRFLNASKMVEVSGSDTNQTENYVWLDAHARHVNDSVRWHWINGQPSG